MILFQLITRLLLRTLTNYSDYGVTYNNTSGEFELDMDVLAAKIEA